jgi:hypothetical protein
MGAGIAPTRPVDSGESSMSAVKQQAIEVIESLPDDCSFDDIHYHLYVREKVQRGLTAIGEGRLISQEEAERRVTEWARSSGQNQASRTSAT